MGTAAASAAARLPTSRSGAGCNDASFCWVQVMPWFPLPTFLITSAGKEGQERFF